MVTISRSVRVAALAAAAAFGLTGFAGTTAQAASQASVPFRVCSPLGCYQQSVEGTAEVRPGGVMLVATLTDRAAGASLLGRFTMGPAGTTQVVRIDDGTYWITASFPGSWSTLTVSACAVPGACVTRTFPLG